MFDDSAPWERLNLGHEIFVDVTKLVLFVSQPMNLLLRMAHSENIISLDVFTKAQKMESCTPGLTSWNFVNFFLYIKILSSCLLYRASRFARPRPYAEESQYGLRQSKKGMWFIISLFQLSCWNWTKYALGIQMLTIVWIMTTLSIFSPDFLHSFKVWTLCPGLVCRALALDRTSIFTWKNSSKINLQDC